MICRILFPLWVRRNHWLKNVWENSTWSLCVIDYIISLCSICRQEEEKRFHDVNIHSYVEYFGWMFLSFNDDSINFLPVVWHLLWRKTKKKYFFSRSLAFLFFSFSDTKNNYFSHSFFSLDLLSLSSAFATCHMFAITVYCRYNHHAFPMSFVRE